MTYQCQACGGTFESDWTDADANAEAAALWGVDRASADPDMVVVCDACFVRLQRTLEAGIAGE